MKINKVLLAGVFAWGAAIAELPSTAIQPDNSAINKREEKNNHALTADKHGTSERDIKISTEIRQALVNDKNLSTYAQNIKIITVDGLVTLKGPVKTLREKQALAKKAREVAGDSKVMDRTEVITE